MTEQPQRPIALQVIPENIPAELKALMTWCCWRYEWNDKRGKWAKIPYTPFTTSHAMVNRVSTLRTFQAAYNCYEQRRDFFDGIFVCLSADDPYAGGDFDHNTDFSRVPSTYAEYSPSGEGIRFIGRGVLPAACKKPEGELYDRKRFLSITGHRLEGFPAEVLPIQPALDTLYEELKGSAKGVKDGSAGQGSRADRVALIPDEDWQEGRAILRTSEINKLLSRLKASSRSSKTGKFDTQLAYLLAEDYVGFHEKWSGAGIIRADGSYDESQIRAVFANGIRMRRFTFPQFAALMSFYFADQCLAKWGTKQAWKEELASLWFRSRAPRQGEYTPAEPEPIARGRAADHAENLERAYGILVSFKAGAEALLQVQDLADALKCSRSAAAGYLSDLEQTGRITRRQAGQYGGIVVTFAGIQIEAAPTVEAPQQEAPETSNGHTAITATELSGMQIEKSAAPKNAAPEAEETDESEAAITATEEGHVYIYKSSTVLSPDVPWIPEKRIRDRVTIDEAVNEAYDNLPRDRVTTGGELKKWPITVQRVREYVEEHYPGQWKYEAIRYRIEQVKKRRKREPFEQLKGLKREVVDKKAAAVRKGIERLEHKAETVDMPEMAEWYAKKAASLSGQLALLAWEQQRRDTADDARIAVQGYSEAEQQEMLDLVERERRDTVGKSARSDALDLVERLKLLKVKRE